MTYQSTARLGADEEYLDRLGACLTGEATIQTDPLADQIIRSSAYGVSLFGPVVAGSPGFDEKYASGGSAAITDGDLLSAVQAHWARLAELVAP